MPSDLYDLLLDDPNVLNVEQVAHDNIPIYFPWSLQCITLGTGFNSTLTSKGNTNPFSSRSAFAQRSLNSTPVRFDDDTGGSSFKKSITSKSTYSYEHVDFKFGISVGGWVLGASVSGAYAKDVLSNKDSQKLSVRSTMRLGTVAYVDTPGLSSEGFSLLRQEGVEKFHQTYGDYYVAGLRLGADNATMLSSSSNTDIQSQMDQLKISLKVFGKNHTLMDKKHVSSTSAIAHGTTVTAFDTLKNYNHTGQAGDAASCGREAELAARNVYDGQQIQERAFAVLQSLHISPGQIITTEQYRRICESGLVVELLLLPYAGLREFVLATAGPAYRGHDLL
ncbi:hypothetical protein BDQ12DRAFT_476790 [Crucibulum laeve]|uniref:MACPF domain-containing protein n=1 Tax=Crucibulum laeve TaxID=68775 RepID=A0A5C3LJA1_9AGAR|nr:hypothetical protein BDQ12DRAFT_476790 [Crucibulum laeve]